MPNAKAPKPRPTPIYTTAVIRSVEGAHPYAVWAREHELNPTLHYCRSFYELKRARAWAAAKAMIVLDHTK